MLYSWEIIKEVIDNVEAEKIKHNLSLLEQEEGLVERHMSLTERTTTYLNFLGELSIGISVGVISIIISFILLVALFHIEF